MRVFPDGRGSDALDIQLDPTDAMGEFRGAVRLPYRSISYRTTVDVAGYAQWSRGVDRQPVSETLDLGVITLGQGYRVAGTVLDSETSTGVPNARVRLDHETGRESHRTRTNAVGGFRFPSLLAPGRYAVQVIGADGYLRVEQPRLVSVGETELDDLTIQVAPLSGLLHGQVVDETTQEGVGQARVHVASPSGSGSVRTDEAGRFTIHAAPAWTGDEAVQVEAMAYHVPRPIAWKDVLENQGRICVCPNPLAWFAAFDARSGKAIEGFDLVLPHGHPGVGILNQSLERSRIVDDPNSPKRAITPPANACVVRVSADGHLPAHVVVPELSSGRRGEVAAVRLDPAVAITCEVVDSAGDPVPPCRIQALVAVVGPANEGLRVVPAERPLNLPDLAGEALREACAHFAVIVDETTTDDGGRGRISASASPSAMLRVLPRVGAPTWVRVGEDDLASGLLRIVVPEPRALTGVVGPRAWLEEAWNARNGMAPVVWITGAGNEDFAQVLGGSRSMVSIDRDGQFRMEQPVGADLRWNVLWRVPGDRNGAGSVFRRHGGMVATDRQRLMIDMSDFMLSAACGRIRDGQGHDVLVRAVPPLSGEMETRVDHEGTFEVDVPAGVYEVAARPNRESPWVILDRDWRVARDASPTGAWELTTIEVRLRVHEAVAGAEWWGVVDSQGNRRASTAQGGQDVMLKGLRPGSALVMRGVEDGSPPSSLRAFLHGDDRGRRVVGYVSLTTAPVQRIEIGPNGRIRKP